MTQQNKKDPKVIQLNPEKMQKMLKTQVKKQFIALCVVTLSIALTDYLTSKPQPIKQEAKKNKIEIVEKEALVDQVILIQKCPQTPQP